MGFVTRATGTRPHVKYITISEYSSGFLVYMYRLMNCQLKERRVQVERTKNKKGLGGPRAAMVRVQLLMGGGWCVAERDSTVPNLLPIAARARARAARVRASVY